MSYKKLSVATTVLLWAAYALKYQNTFLLAIQDTAACHRYQDIAVDNGQKGSQADKDALEIATVSDAKSELTQARKRIHELEKIVESSGLYGESSSTKIDDNNDSNEGKVATIPREKDAVALIAFGNATQTRLVERCVRSVRSRGNWTSWIVILTDQLGRYDELQAMDDRVIVLLPRHDDMEDIPDSKFKLVKMKYKRFKMLLPSYFDMDSRLSPAQRILYLDIDNVVCQPILPWMDKEWKKSESLRMELWNQHNQKNQTSYIQMFEESRAARVAHSGVILMHRQESRGCLDHWKMRLDQWPRRYTRDQAILREMMKAGYEITNCQILVWKRHERKSKNLIFPIEKDFVKRNYVRFLHITNTYWASQTSADIQEAFLEDALLLTPAERNSNESLAKTVHTF